VNHVASARTFLLHVCFMYSANNVSDAFIVCFFKGLEILGVVLMDEVE
jgi:hypothetical protein